jgi:competence protein ComEA
MLFSPNRLLTTKEQLLLVGVLFALVAGAGALFWHGRHAGEQRVEAAAPAPAPPADAPRPVPPPTPPAGADLPAPGMIAMPPPAPVASPAPSEIAVAVRGGVRNAGLQRLPADSRVADLIMRAGGTTPEGDVSGLNLAARLVDGTTLTVPVVAERVAEGDRMVLRNSGYRLLENPADYLMTPQQGAPAFTAAAAPAPSSPTAAPAAPPVPGGPAKGLINLNTATQAELETLPGIGPVYAGNIVAYREANPFRTVEDVEQVPGIGPKRLEAMRPLVTVE